MRLTVGYYWRFLRTMWGCFAAAHVLAAGCESMPSPEAPLILPTASPEAPSIRSLEADAAFHPTVAAAPTSANAAVVSSSSASNAQSKPIQSAEGQQADAVIPVQTIAPGQIDLGMALRIAGVDNPTINLAAERIREALALQLQARALLLPNLNAGLDYHANNGPVQSSPGQIVNVNDQSFYGGFGAGALVGTTVAYPGVWLYTQLDNAIFDPLTARQNVILTRSNAAAVNNNVLGDVAVAYLRLVGSEARLEELRRSDKEGSEMVKITQDFAEAKVIRDSDARRARSYYDLVEQQRISLAADVDIASAQLCRLLNLDPSNRLRTPQAAIEQFRLISEDSNEADLIAQALQTRPETVATNAAVREAQIRVRQEKIRPLLPTISIGMSNGSFSGASNLSNSSLSSLSGRTDFDLVAVWNLQNLGLGNRAHVREAAAVVGQAVAEFEASRNRICTEVVEALASARSTARQLDYARRAVTNANDAFQLDLDRIKGGGPLIEQANPVELLYSFRELLESRLALVDAITEYDVAQFRLFVATGSNLLAGPDVSFALPTTISNGSAITPGR